MSVKVHKDGRKTPTVPFGGDTTWGVDMFCKTCQTVVRDIEHGYGVYYHRKTGRCPNDDVQVHWSKIKDNRWLKPFDRKRDRRAAKRAGRQASKRRP